MRGTRSTPGLSRFQSVLVTSLWLSSFLVLALVLAPRFPDNPAATMVGVAAFLPSALATWAIYRFGAHQQTQITTFEGMRGQFTVYDVRWPLLLLPAVLLAGVGVSLLAETPGRFHATHVWAIAGLAALGMIGGPCVMMCRHIHAFRIDDDGQIAVRRWSRYQALRISEFAAVRGDVVRGRYGSVALTQLVFAGGPANLRQVVLPLSSVFSRRYHTLVYATVVSAFFLDQCETAGFTVQFKGTLGDHGWVARRTPDPQRPY